VNDYYNFLFEKELKPASEPEDIPEVPDDPD